MSRPSRATSRPGAHPPTTWSLRWRLTGMLAALTVVAWLGAGTWLSVGARHEAEELLDAAMVEGARAVLAVALREARSGGGERRADTAERRGGVGARRGRVEAHSDDDDEAEEAHEGGERHERVDDELPPIGPVSRGSDTGADARHVEGSTGRPPHRLVYQVRDANGRLAYRSPGAPAEALAGAGATGFGSVDLPAGRFRVYTLRAASDGAAGELTLHIAQPLAERELQVMAAVGRAWLPGVVLVLTLVAGASVLVRRVTEPLITFSAAIDARRPGQAGIGTDDAKAGAVGLSLPSELEPVRRAVEGLMQRVDAALVHERTLTADAAHELRTPLAALRAQAQVALRASEPAEREAALRSLMGGVDRSARLLDAVLTLARLDAKTLDLGSRPPLDLSALVSTIVDEHRYAAAARAVDLAVDMPGGPLPMRADADVLAVLVRNLVDNAIRHAHGRVVVSLAVDRGRADDSTAAGEGGFVVLTVADDGPGLSQADAERAFDRFWRADPAGSGSGLGLPMARRAAQLHGGELRLRTTDHRGAVFETRLPLR